MQPVSSSKSGPLKGHITVPGDKSISHRALMIGSQTIGKVTITGLLEGEDVLHTADALKKLGVRIDRMSESHYEVYGVGIGGFTPPKEPLYFGNAGTGSRLMMGLLASYPFETTFTGDASLSKRPMKRVITPLKLCGAQFKEDRGTLPLTMRGIFPAMPIEYTLPVASAQVKSAALLSGLNIPGHTVVVEPTPTRDHTERMLKYLGADIRVEGTKITLVGKPELKAKPIQVPADPSSAAFLIAAALMVPGSKLTIGHVCLNPHRTGLFTTLKEMGAKIDYANQRDIAGEPVADIHIEYSKLKGVTVPADRAPSMIDEYPILAAIAATAEGTTKMLGLEELKVKESNRLKAIFDGLKTCGVDAVMGEDWLEVKGGKVPGGGKPVETHMDHRIAMAFLVLGLTAEKSVTVDDARFIATSFPGFIETMRHVGAQIN